MYDLVKQMYEQFGMHPPPNLLFRIVAMQEELTEFGVATIAKNRHQQLDALIDLTIFVFGTAHLLGFSAEQFEGAFKEVMRANMSKVVGLGKRGYDVDLLKPLDFVPPNLERFL